MKYFLLGAFSSAFLLYGIAMAYGATGTTSLTGHRRRAWPGATGTPALALVAMGLLAVGLGFKVAAVPFHAWTPDVYQGAPDAGDGVHVGRDEGRRVRRPAAGVHGRLPPARSGTGCRSCTPGRG